ncbi:non-homologous end-joining DNA ligase [Allonocardiopsis opalescens]|uniref:Bifunctional non-homologous end joining protein LigD n=1 Tax=Allonocardiopsis opalescens TaxID=1144618 RepID=A0A2T0Q0J5_9ACTN|nr:non-homologous end-joining DNA ligase [Allonocardiopsis opalescens]PRX97317.1 bifunctional non-homologous end joining protein LigD [Allonocardiopsis opalescens]
MAEERRGSGGEGKLRTYHGKRDFARTSEPRGGRRRRRGAEPRFVIQHHAARADHYDVRLEVDGVLKSWAVPKGPSTDPRVKRLAVPTEDHPMEYLDFEGTIPQGEYGGGTVLVWDTGTYRNQTRKRGRDIPVEDALAHGHVSVWLEGEKLRGGYAFTRFRGGSAGRGRDEAWLLVKEDDDEADARRRPVSSRPESVLTGRGMRAVAADEDGGGAGRPGHRSAAEHREGRKDRRSEAGRATRGGRDRRRGQGGESDVTATREAVRAGRRSVPLGHPDKVLIEEGRLTKRGLAEHFLRASEPMLAEIGGHPLALQRFPDGTAGQSFYQKRLPDHAPDWLSSVEVRRHEDDTMTMLVCEDAASLVWLADQAVLTPHPWLSRADAPDLPDRMIFDLDPPDADRPDFDLVRRTAWRLRALLDELDVPGYLMTTGSRGLHVVVPLRREEPFDEVKHVARQIAELLVARDPGHLTTEVRKKQRHGRLFVDVLRNAYAQLAVAPYAVRPLPQAPVAAPVAWDELDGLESARQWTVRTIEARLAEGVDPWRGMHRRGRSLARIGERVRRLSDGG